MCSLQKQGPGHLVRVTVTLQPGASRRLPERIRPTICAFGGLADRFLPFDAGGGRTVELGLANVVMKAVQARRAGVATSMACAGKYGDDASHSKAQVIVCSLDGSTPHG